MRTWQDIPSLYFGSSHSSSAHLDDNISVLQDIASISPTFRHLRTTYWNVIVSLRDNTLGSGTSNEFNLAINLCPRESWFSSSEAVILPSSSREFIPILLKEVKLRTSRELISSSSKKLIPFFLCLSRKLFPSSLKKLIAFFLRPWWSWFPASSKK